MKSQAAIHNRRRRRRRRHVFIAIVSLTVLLALAALVDFALYNNKVHAGVSIAGRSMSGLTRDELTVQLTRIIQDTGTSTVTLRSEDKSWTVTPGDVGADIDIAGAAAAAMDAGHESNFLVNLGHRFALLFSDRDIALQGTVDFALMDEVVSRVARVLDIPPVETGVVFVGDDTTVVKGQKGLVVDRETLRRELKELLFAFSAAELAVPMVVKEPALQVEDTRLALVQAKTMVAAPVELRAGDKTWTLTPREIIAYIDYTSENRDGVSTLVAYLSAGKMSPLLDDIAATVDSPSVNATFESNGQQAWVVPAQAGKRLDPEETAAALTAAALKITDRTARVAMTVVEPTLTTEEAEAMGIEDKLGGYTTKWEGTEDRQNNVRITTEYASDVVLAPGEIYDFDRQIGPRTEARGYKLAPGITAGELEDVLGGGICQVSTTLFNAAFLSGLEIVERKNHSIYIDHYPKGRDATVSAGGPNMRFRNDTNHHILIRGTSDGITTTFNIYGTDEGRTVSHTTSDFYDEVARNTYEIPAYWLGPGTTYIKIAGQAGKSIKVERTVKAKDGSVIHQDTFISVWKMITREIEVGTGSTTTTRLASTTVTT